MKKHRRFLGTILLVIVVATLLVLAGPVSAENVEVAQSGYGYGYASVGGKG